MPTTRDKKDVAMDRMHLNYQYALFTLIHDEELVNFEWKDDGSPCIALALSTWFTRGWTALELWESDKVKVLFRNPEKNVDNKQSYIVKDLEEVLARPGDLFVHPAHRAASVIIRRLMKKTKFYEVQVSRILSNLKIRDRLMIAGLMGQVTGFKSIWSKSQITREILTHSKKLLVMCLLHGQSTMAYRGPWSWCPTSILNLNESEPGTELQTHEIERDNSIFES